MMHNELHVVREVELGDVLMVTPALRRFKELNPHYKIHFYTQYQTLVRGLHFIDHVYPVHAAPKDKSIYLRYHRGKHMTDENKIPVRSHIASIFGEIIGVEVQDKFPSCTINPRLLSHYRHKFGLMPHPWVVINRKAGPYTQNKNWPNHHWMELINKLCKWASVIEIGKEVVHERYGQRYLNITGQLSLEALVAVMATADLHIGPVSGPVHLAAAFRVPSVVIYGGYEEPICSSYPGNVNFYSPVACAPCWMKAPCPFDKYCLQQIEPTQVDAAAQVLWADTKVSPISTKVILEPPAVFSHGGDIGDLIYALPTIKALGGGELRLVPTKQPVREQFSPQRVDSLRKFLEAQLYITSVEYGDAVVGVNLDEWRKHYYLCKQKSYNLCDVQAVAAGLPRHSHDEIWLTCAQPKAVAKVVIARSSRFHNPRFPWNKVARVYGPSAVFVGLPEEHISWQSEFGAIKYQPTDDFWELCCVIAGAELFIGNQSAPMAIAIGLGIPRIIQEVCPTCPNCLFTRSSIIYGKDTNVILPGLPGLNGVDKIKLLRPLSTHAAPRNNIIRTLPLPQGPFIRRSHKHR